LADTAVTDNALEQCLAEIRKVLGDDSRNPRFIKTVPRAGYRFIGKVEEVDLFATVTEAAKDSTQFERESPQAGARPQRAEFWMGRRPLLVAVAIILVSGVVGAIYLIQKRRARTQSLSNVTLPQTAGKRSVAVMFFDN